jgi:hypothetical protein
MARLMNITTIPELGNYLNYLEVPAIVIAIVLLLYMEGKIRVKLQIQEKGIFL